MFLIFNRRIKQGVRMDEISETHSRRPYVFAHFNVAYFGICVPHAWIYCIIHRADMDFGGFPIAVPLYIALSLFMLAFLLVARASGTPRLGSKLDWPLAALQALATIPLVVAVPLDDPAMLYTAIACAIAGGIGIAWLYLQWAPFYAELDVRNAIACIFVAMAAGSAIKIIIDLLPGIAAAALMTVMPFASVLLVRSALSHQPPLERQPRIFHDPSLASVPWKIILGVVVYSLIIGVIQSMALQAEAPIPAWITSVVLHCTEIVVAVCVLWWVFPRGGLLHFSNLWRTVLLFTATGLFFLPIINPALASWAIVLISIAQTLVVMILWIMLADIAHHSKTSPYVIFGSGWVAYTLPFALGEIGGKAAGLHGWGTQWLVLLAYVLTIAAVFALNESNFSQRRIFADLDMPTPEQSFFAGIDESCRALGRERGLSPRETEVLQLLCKGRSKSYIAESLFISENTVRSHSKHIYQKLNVHSKQDILDLIAER